MLHLSAPIEGCLLGPSFGGRELHSSLGRACSYHGINIRAILNAELASQIVGLRDLTGQKPRKVAAGLNHRMSLPDLQARWVVLNNSAGLFGAYAAVGAPAICALRIAVGAVFGVAGAITLIMNGTRLAIKLCLHISLDTLARLIHATAGQSGFRQPSAIASTFLKLQSFWVECRILAGTEPLGAIAELHLCNTYLDVQHAGVVVASELEKIIYPEVIILGFRRLARLDAHAIHIFCV